MFNFVVLLPWLPYYKIKAIKIYRKYLMCQNILYYWQYKQKQIVICFEAFNFYCGRSEDFTIVSWLDICSKQGSHFISLSNFYKNVTFKETENFIYILVYSLTIDVNSRIFHPYIRKFLDSDQGLHWQMWLWL